jgi:type IV pilus assembly protein PilW
MTCGHRQQRGISLVEIMVALLLSLVLSAGVLEIYLSSKQSYRAQEGYSRLQENARFAIETLAHYIRFTGYKLSPADTNDAAFALTTNPSPIFALGQVLAGSDGGGSNSDSITFRYKDDDLLGDCGTPPSGAGAQSERIVTFAIDADNELSCTVYVDGALTHNNQPLVEGVENMQILYGIDTDNDGSANQYVIASDVPAWSAVSSVRVSLLLSTLQAVSTEADTRSYDLLGTAVAAPAANAGSRFWRRHRFTTTISLRNNVP